MRRPLRDRQVRRRQLPRHPRHPRGGTILSRRQKNRPKRPARLRPPVRGIPEALSSLRLPAWLKPDDLRIFCLRTFQDCLRMTRAGRFLPSSPRLMTWGTAWNGWCLTARISVSPRSESGCSLSDILIPDAPEKYFLSSEQTEKLLYKSSAGRRDRESMTPEGPPVHRLPEVEEKE